MTMSPARPTTTADEVQSPTPASRRPPLPVIGAVAAVVLAVGGWFLLKPGASTPSAQPAASFTHPPSTSSSSPAASVKRPVVTAPVLTKAQAKAKAAYLKAGNKICTTMNARSSALGDLPQSAKAAAHFLRQQAAIDEHARKQLMALPQPGAEKAKLRVMYAGIAHLDAQGTAAAKALEAGQKTKAQTYLKAIVKGQSPLNAAFNSYGLTACGT